MATPQNPMMQQAAAMFSNPNAAAVPPASPGVIDPTQHPVIKAIIQALSQGMQGYSQTAMDPRERMQRQEMDAQKAEAMARLGMQQQQLGFEGQRVGIEQQRANTEATGVQQTGEYQRGELAESGKRTAIEKTRADQAYAAETENLKREAQKYTAEYGPGGLRSQEAAAKTSQAASEASRAGTDARLASIADRRQKAEETYRQGELQRSGLSAELTTLENERSRQIQAETEAYKLHPWLYGYDNYEKKLQAINDDIEKKKTAVNAAAGWKPGAPGGALTQPGQGGAGTKPAYQKDGKWYDAATNKPI